MKKLLAIAALAICTLAIPLGGCSTSNIVAGSSSIYGIGAQTIPDGTVKASIGASLADFVTTPLLGTANGAKPILVPTACGGQDAVSVMGTITGAAQSGVQTKAPAISLTMGRGLAVGEPARLMALADVQEANPNVNAMREYHDCSQTTPPLPATAAVASGH